MIAADIPINIDNIPHNINMVIDDKVIGYNKLMIAISLKNIDSKLTGFQYSDDTWIVPKEIIPILKWLELPFDDKYKEINNDNVIDILLAMRLTSISHKDLNISRAIYSRFIVTIINNYPFIDHSFDNKLIDIITVSDFGNINACGYNQYLLDRLADKLPNVEILYWFAYNKYIGDYSKYLNKVKQLVVLDTIHTNPYTGNRTTCSFVEKNTVAYLFTLFMRSPNREFAEELYGSLIN